MLKGFARISLSPGREISCSLKLCAEDLRIYDRDMRAVLEPGIFELMVYEGEKEWWKGSLEIILDMPNR